VHKHYLLLDDRTFGGRSANIFNNHSQRGRKKFSAEKAGITPFSKIVSINGKPVSGINQFIAEVKAEKGKQVYSSGKM